MVCEIIAVGTELLLGQITNTNAQYLAQRLSELGVNSYFQTVVGDNAERLKEALDTALKRSDIIITTGGLGPTADDLTKETIAEYFGLKCILDEKSLRLIEDRFRYQNSYMADNNKKQAEMPEGCIILKNDNGTAPGAIVESGDKAVVILPGPPFEMKPMFDNHVFGYIAKKVNGVICSKTLRIFGIGESALEEKLSDMMKTQTNPTVAPYAKTGEVTLRITAKADNEESAHSLISPVECQIRDMLGDMVYGEGEDNSIHQTVVNLLISKGLKLSVAESCTGGLIASKITSVSGASECFDCGVVTYSNEQKENLINVKRETLDKFGAVSHETALEMAMGVRNISNSDIGISVTGIAGPSGGSAEKPVGLVYIGICADNVHEAREFRFTGGRDTVRERSAMNAFDMLRRYILGNCN